MHLLPFFFFSSFLISFYAKCSNVDQEEIFRSSDTPKNIFLKVDESHVKIRKTLNDNDDFVVLCQRIRCPNDGVSVESLPEELRITSDRGNTNVDYELKIPARNIEKIEIDAGKVQIDFTYPYFRNMKVKCGSIMGAINSFFGNFQLDAGNIKNLVLNHDGVMDLNEPQSRIDVTFGNGDFLVTFPENSEVSHRVMCPPSRSSKFSTDFQEALRADILVFGNFGSGNFSVKKRV